MNSINQTKISKKLITSQKQGVIKLIERENKVNASLKTEDLSHF